MKNRNKLYRIIKNRIYITVLITLIVASIICVQDSFAENVENIIDANEQLTDATDDDSLQMIIGELQSEVSRLEEELYQKEELYQSEEELYWQEEVYQSEDLYQEEPYQLQDEVVSQMPSESYLRTYIENNEQPIIELETLPFEMKSEVTGVLQNNEIYKTSVEIKNNTNQTLEQITIVLSSDDSRFSITSYENEEIARERLAYLQQIREQGVEDDTAKEAKKEAECKIIKQVSMMPGQSISIDLVLVALETINVEESEIIANVESWFFIDNTAYKSSGNWRLTSDPTEDPVEGPTEEPTEGPTEEPTEGPTEDPTEEPTEEPTEDPTEEPTEDPEDRLLLEQQMSSLIERMDRLIDVSIEKDDQSQDNELMMEDLVGNEDEEGGEDETVSVVMIEDEMTDMDEETIEDNDSSDFSYFDYDSDDYYTYTASSDQINTSTPYVLIQSYSHQKSIYAGDSFTLKVMFLNTSQKINLESTLVKIEPSESLSVVNGTDALFIGNLSAGTTSEQSIDLSVASDSKNATMKLSFSISFEYVEKNERKQGSAAESITFPILQRNRLAVGEPKYDDYIEAGEESVITIPYTNKGFTALYNIEAELSLENADIEQPTVFVGNVDSGKNGTMSFLITPYDGGDYEGVVKLTYEDAARKESSIDIPVRFTSEMSYYADDENGEEYDDWNEDLSESQGISVYWIIAIAGGAVLLIVIVILCVAKKKKSANQDEEDWLKNR